ncbi:signal transduction protein with GAF and PtsI domain [Bradyrhizobium sp. LB13.1]
MLTAHEGLVGLVASEATPLNLNDAQSHPAFSFRPETGEEIYHSFLGVPVLRAGNTLGVLVVQNRAKRNYVEEELEALQTTAMVLAELIASGELSALAQPGQEPAARHSAQKVGAILSEGIALGHVVLHEPRVVIKDYIAEDLPKEIKRLDTALAKLRADLDRMLERGDVAEGGEHREVLEAYRMFANDQGWSHKLHEAVATGLTAEAAVERVQSDTRARMLRSTDPYLRDRLHDLEDLGYRLMRQLVGQDHAPSREQLPDNAIVIARAMGPAALLDYDRKRLRGIVLEEGTANSHVSIVARALGIPAVGEVPNAPGIADPGDAIIVDGTSGSIYVRPSQEVEAAFAERVRFRARRQAQYLALRDLPCVTKDGQKVELMINAGLAIDLPHIEDTGSAGIGLFRTELQFMVGQSLPRTSDQLALYRTVLDAAGTKPVTFRTLDIGGDKALPYMEAVIEENPALGWRAIRLGLDRPGLLRGQIRALLRAGGGPCAAHHVPDDLGGRRIRFGEGAGRTRADLSAPARPHPAGADRHRHHGRGAGAALSARRASEEGRLHFGRLQRSVPVPVRGRPRQRKGRRALRHHVGADPACAARHRAQVASGKEIAVALRRDGVEADRRAGADRDGLPLAVAFGDRAWPGQGDGDRSRRQEGRRDARPLAGRPRRERLDPAEADGVCRGRRPGVVAGLSPLPAASPFSAS